MKQNHHELNLARKWRPQRFSEIVGQGLSIRMLRNGLYLKKYFPLYIFAGQRGCGKTSTARIFAAALNCENLNKFQEQPKKHSVPCRECSSCLAMSEKNHADFIEMDAASHTGVENVRQILESASFVSISGGSKIYLIDEAHMLSRAAFNAFLKILEEPPVNVFFILATTELHKIPETVRSRAFQVFFNAIDSELLHKHIKELCDKEEIAADDDAISALVAESGGSVRDAINLLERVRLLSDKVTGDIVLSALGKISDGRLFELFNILIDKNSKELLVFLDKVSYDKLSPQSLWEMAVNLTRGLIWVKHGVSKLPSPFERSVEQVKKLSTKISIHRVNAIMQLFFSQEELFLKTTQKHLFLETVLLQVCGQINTVDLEGILKTFEFSTSAPTASVDSSIKTPEPGVDLARLKEKLSGFEDHLLSSIFKQAELMGFQDGKVSIRLANSSSFLQDKIVESLGVITAVAKLVLPGFESFVFLESKVSLQPKITPKATVPAATISYGVARNKPADISDKEKWPKANLLREHFSGKIEVVGK